MKKVITLGGLHGTGKSSVADKIAREFNLRRTSAGIIFRKMAKDRGMTLEEFSKVAEGNEEIDRELDATLAREAEKGDIVLDGQLAAWMAGENADFKILLTAPDDVRIKRIADRDSVDFKYAQHETLAREASERDRYFEYYQIDITDLSIYDFVLNTEKFNLNQIIRIITNVVQILWEH
jgi:cytidylate kinase